MKKVFTLLALLFLASTLTVHAQTAENTGQSKSLTDTDQLKIELQQNHKVQQHQDRLPNVGSGTQNPKGVHYSHYQNKNNRDFVIWDNGPIITDSLAGSSGSHYSRLQDTTLGMETFGFGCQHSAGNSIADDFEVITDWEIHKITVYAYQTGSDPPSTFTGVYMQIWDGDPTAGGSVIWGDLNTNVLESTEWTNIWRVNESAPEENRPIMAVVADVTYILLDAGTYWLEYSLDGTGTSGPWNPPVTITGETTTGNAIQNQSGNWVALTDFGPQGIPFIIEGSPGAWAIDDVAVFSILEPASGINLGNAEPITVRLFNNGADTQTSIPVEVSMNGPTGSVMISETWSGSLSIAQTVDFTLTQTMDLSVFGDYEIEACTQLPGDENPDNDCKIKTVTNFEPSLCIPDYSNGCGYGDGLIYWSLENIEVPDIPCSGVPEWYHDYRDMIHNLTFGDFDLTVVAGYSTTNFDVWIDFNDDLYFSNEELVLNDAQCVDANVPYTFTITVPTYAVPGEHFLRFRTNWIDLVTHECQTYSYGNCCDFSADILPPLIMDVGVEFIDMLDFYEPGIIIPKATLKNFGMGMWTFDAIMTFGNYSSTVEVTDLIPGSSQQVIFDTLEIGPGTYTAEVCTFLPEDENPANDCKTKTITVVEGETWYAYLAEDPSGTLVEGPVNFDPSAPGGITQLAPTSSNEIITGACWAGDTWWGCQQGGGLYWIDHTNGDMTFVGDGPALNGLAFDGTVVYGASDTELFEIDPAIGQGTPIGIMGNAGGQMMGIACNENGDLFGFDVGDDTFYSIDKATGAATAIGPLGYNFEGPQDMAFNKATGQCYLTGYTTTGGLYAVDINTGAASLIAEFPDGIRLAGFAIPDAAPPPVGDPPQGFDAQFVEGVGVECSWGMNTPNEAWLGFDDGTNSNNQYNYSGIICNAINLDRYILYDYDEWELTHIKLFPNKVTDESEITLKVWSGMNPVTLIHEQAIENPNWNTWNTIQLTNSVTINSTVGLLVGFQYSAPEGEQPIGHDDGPAVAGYGDLVSMEGVYFYSLKYAIGADLNFNIHAFVQENPGEEYVVLSPHLQGYPDNSGISNSTEVKSESNPKLEFLGVNIYRDGNQVNSNLIEPGVTEYIDPFFDPGTWTYTARAVYDEGLSDPTPGVEVIIPGTSQISVAPDSIFEIHETPPQITTQELTITNTGDEPLEWEIAIDFGNEKSKIQKISTKEFARLSGNSMNNDVGIWSIVEPASGVYLGNEEPVTIKIQNYGGETQTEIPWEVTWSGPTGGETFSGTWTGSLSTGEEVDITLDETVDMSVFGDYEFEACTQLSGDENPDNDCKTKWIGCVAPSLCIENLYSSGCGFGDGLISWQLANVDIPDIPCSGEPEWYHDYTGQVHQLEAGETYSLIVEAGYESTYFDVWIDWNDDLQLTDDERIVDDGFCSSPNTPYVFEIVTPASAPIGNHVLRFRTNWVDVVLDPCETYQYGNCCDFGANLIGITPMEDWLSVDTTSGVIASGASQIVTAIFNSEDFYAGSYEADMVILSNDPENPEVIVPVSLSVADTVLPASIIFEPFESYLAGDYLVQQAVAQGKEYWTTWSGSPGTVEDPFVSDFYAYEGFNAMVIEESNDAVLVLPENYTYGVFYVDFEVMVPAGKTGYFNCLQSFAGTSSEWGMQCFLDVDGAGSVDAGGEGSGSFTYEYDEWNHVQMMIDLDEDHAEMYFNDDLIVEWQWSTGSFGTGSLNAFHAMNFFAWSDNGTPGAFFDNIDISVPETNFLLPPNNFTGYVDWLGFGFEWMPPGSFEPQWITYSQEEINNSIGTNQEINFDVAARWEPADLTNFVTGAVTKINFVPGEPGDICTYSLRVWQGSQPDPTLIYDEVLTEIVSDVWNEIELENPVPFDNSQDLWIGFNCNTTSGFPAGCDDGPQDEGLGNMMFWEGEWVTLSSLNPDLIFNWAIMAYIESSPLNEPPTPLSITYPQHNSGGQFTLCPQLIDPPAVFSPDNVAATLLGYNLYRDGEIILEAYPGTDYFDGDVDAGILYEYYLTALYDVGESPPTQTLYLEIPDGIEEVAQDAVQLYPNPAGEQLNISSELEILSINLYDVKGVNIFKIDESGTNFQINTSHLKPGVYTLQLETEKGLSVHKLVIR